MSSKFGGRKLKVIQRDQKEKQDIRLLLISFFDFIKHLNHVCGENIQYVMLPHMMALFPVRKTTYSEIIIGYVFSFYIQIYDIKLLKGNIKIKKQC